MDIRLFTPSPFRIFSRTIVDEISGIGKTRKMALISEFKTIERLKNATLEELASVEGMNKKSAQAVFEHFRKGQKSD